MFFKKYLNLYVFLLEKISSFGLIWLAIQYALPLYEYTQSTFIASILAILTNGYSSVLIAKLQHRFPKKDSFLIEQKNNFEILKEGFYVDKIFMHRIFGRWLLSLIIVLTLSVILESIFGYLEELRLNSNYMIPLILLYFAGESIVDLYTQYLRFYKIEIAYLWRLFLIIIRLTSISIGISTGNLLHALVVFGLTAFIVVFFIFWKSGFKLFPFTIFTYFRKRFIWSFLTLGISSIAAIFISNFDRILLPLNMSYSDNMLEIYAQYRFYLSFIILLVPFVGFWLGPYAQRKLITGEKFSKELRVFLLSIFFHNFTGIVFILSAFFYFYANEIIGRLFVDFVSIGFYIASSGVLITLSIVFYNFYTKTIVNLNLGTAIIYFSLSHFIGYDLVFLFYAGVCNLFLSFALLIKYRVVYGNIFIFGSGSLFGFCTLLMVILRNSSFSSEEFLFLIIFSLLSSFIIELSTGFISMKFLIKGIR